MKGCLKSAAIPLTYTPLGNTQGTQGGGAEAKQLVDAPPQAPPPSPTPDVVAAKQEEMDDAGAMPLSPTADTPTPTVRALTRKRGFSVR